MNPRRRRIRKRARRNRKLLRAMAHVIHLLGVGVAASAL
jgi:hypothetical protein